MEREITVDSSRGPFQTQGQCWQDFAVIREPESVKFMIVHLPSGMNIGGYQFKTEEVAAEAMIEISRLRNRWVEIPENEKKKLTDDIERIVRKYNVTESLLVDQTPRQNFNGYEEPVFEKDEK